MVNSTKIKERAAELDIRQSDIAKALGLRQSTVSQKINNVRPLRVDEAEIMAEMLRIEDIKFSEYFFSVEGNAKEGDRTMSTYTPILRENPKAKPLARTLVAAAAEQGASVDELEIACEMAQRAYQMARDESVPKFTAPLKGKAEAALERL